MKKWFVAVVIAAVVVTGGAVALAQSNTAGTGTGTGTGTGAGAGAGTGTGTGAGAGAGTEPAPLAATAPFRDYSPEAVAMASATDKVVLFFHAKWCSTCKLLSDDITANVDAIPENVRILLVDFDTETALKQRYEVTLQHTLVQVSAEGDEIASWNLTPTLDSLLSQLE